MFFYSPFDLYNNSNDSLAPQTMFAVITTDRSFARDTYITNRIVFCICNEALSNGKYTADDDDIQISWVN